MRAEDRVAKAHAHVPRKAVERGVADTHKKPVCRADEDRRDVFDLGSVAQDEDA